MDERTGFEVEITQTEGEPINLDEKSIKTVEFKIDTVEEDVKDRSENVINKVVIIGNITPENREETRKLALWSLDKKREKVYREMSITLATGGETLRTYRMDKAFCIDYIETFGIKGENTFELVAAQRKDNLGSIKVGSV